MSERTKGHFTWCSTPFGIRGRITFTPCCKISALPGAQRLSASEEGSQPGSPGVLSSRLLCAQRLSASEEGSLVGGDYRIEADGCSTPFGIRGRITKRQGMRTDLESSAQRLSASEEGSLERQGHILDGKRVLNAFRHQRKDHKSAYPCSCSAAPCSTPFGIRGRITGVARADDGQSLVLNAFRHQRKDHREVRAPQSARSCAQRLSASEEGSLARSTASLVGSRGAQRLSASEEGSHFTQRNRRNK